jgi:hypothetical protein
LGSFREIDFFEVGAFASECLSCLSWGVSLLEHGERAVESAVGRHLIALDRREFGPVGLVKDEASRAPEERRLRPRGFSTTPS